MIKSQSDWTDDLRSYILIRNRRCLFIFRDGSNQDICVCPDFMTCEDKTSLAMEKENTLHLIYGSGFVIFFIVLISKYIVLLPERLKMSKLVRFNQKPACWSNWYPDFVKVSVQKLKAASTLWIKVRWTRVSALISVSPNFQNCMSVSASVSAVSNYFKSASVSADKGGQRCPRIRWSVSTEICFEW